MFETDGTATSQGPSGRPKRALIWIVRCLVLMCIILSLLAAALRLASSVPQIGDLATKATVFDVWSVLIVLETVFALTAIFGAGIALVQRRLVAALLFSILAWPIGFVIEANRCDNPSCRAMVWASLPRSAYDWSIRIRPVADQHEARILASQILHRTGSPYSPYTATQFAGYWIVSTINEDGRPGPHTVRVDIRTGEARFVPCPADRILCGMELPVISASGQVFSNARWGFSMTFPAGRAVCFARPEDDARRDEARGFYGMIRDANIPCDIADPSRTLGLEALTEPAVAKAHLQRCAPISPATLRAFRGVTPAFPGHGGLVCEEVGEGQIAVSVFAVDGPHSKSDGQIPLYLAWMLTDSAHLVEDAESFVEFLESVRTPPNAG